MTRNVLSLGFRQPETWRASVCLEVFSMLHCDATIWMVERRILDNGLGKSTLSELLWYRE